MLIVGVTGGIGAGKSTVSELFTRLGARLIDADRIARQVVEKDPRILPQLSQAFGADILQADGTLNRRKLGRRAFRSRRDCQRLNDILHPVILLTTKSQLEQLRSSGYEGIVILDAALLVECRALSMVDKVVVVNAPEGIRRQRLMEHKNLSPQEIEERMAAQLPPEAKREVADFVIDNAGTLAQLEEQVGQVWRELTANLGQKNNRDPLAG
jgi:dephospho-CoA kinase